MTERVLLEEGKRFPLSHYIDLKIAAVVASRSRANFDLRGQSMAVFANDYIGIHINQFGVFEREELTDLFHFLEPLASVFTNGTALDIGANVGNHAVFFSKHFRQVHAFEPHPRIFDVLALNAKWAGNVQAHAIGLGDEPGTFALSSDLTHLGLSSMKHGDTEGGVQVSVERLDDSPLDLSGLCFAKMDVEGFEANVLRGGARTLAEHQPIVVLEQHAGEFAENGGTESIAALTALGYVFAWPRNKPLARTWLMRRLRELATALFGTKHEMVTAPSVPKANYTMLIAVPPRFQSQLGLTQSG